VPERIFLSGKSNTSEKEKANEYHITYHSGSIIVRRLAGLALQPQLGLWWQWDRWIPFAPGHPWFAI
jgi:hypothetical protein